MTESEHQHSETWRMMLSGEHPDLVRNRHLFKQMPATLRCKTCNAPLQGVSAPLVRLLFDRYPSKPNPHFCNVCHDFATTHPGGAEFEMTLLFADIRGSTALAEKMGPAAFSQLINRFYVTATNVLVKSDAWIDKLIGDEVTAIYVPGLAGKDHARLAIGAAQDLLEATGSKDKGDAHIPIGIGVHTGVVFAGTVGSETGMMDFTVLGDPVNVTARLASQAGSGEALISEATCAAAGFDVTSLEQRRLQLKGRTELLDVRVLHVGERLAATP